MPITDLELGKLVAHVDACTTSISRLTKEMHQLETNIARLDKAMSKGKGVFAGIILMAGGIGTVIGIAWKTLVAGN